MATARTDERLTRAAERYEQSQFERLLGNAARIALVFLGLMALVVALKLGQVVLAPVWLAVVIGLMFGPLADFFEARSISPALSAGIVVLLFVGLIILAVLLLAVPLSEWIGKIPEIWQKLRAQVAALKGPLDSVAGLEAQMTAVFGTTGAMPVRVEDGSTVVNLALVAPEIGAQMLLFLASLYFFLATREQFRVSVLSLCVSRRMRWRTAHIFSDVEGKVSRFLVSVTMLNAGVGAATGAAAWVLGLPSPLLWGVLAAVLNYTPYVGQAVMIAILGFVGLGTQPDLTHALLPVGSYLLITLVEGQFVTPHFLGRTMTVNPFMILLATTLSLWLWGPIGGLVSVPSLLIVQSVLMHVLPSRPVQPRRPVRRTPAMTDRDVILANAARVIRERAEQEAAKSAARTDEKPAPPSAPVREGVPAGTRTA